VVVTIDPLPHLPLLLSQPLEVPLGCFQGYPEGGGVFGLIQITAAAAAATESVTVRLVTAAAGLTAGAAAAAVLTG
jgi:hypothetical protein